MIDLVYLSALPLAMRTTAHWRCLHRQLSSVDALAASTCTAEDVLVYLNKLFTLQLYCS